MNAYEEWLQEGEKLEDLRVDHKKCTSAQRLGRTDHILSHIFYTQCCGFDASFGETTHLYSCRLLLFSVYSSSLSFLY